MNKVSIFFKVAGGLCGAIVVLLVVTLVISFLWFWCLKVTPASRRMVAQSQNVEHVASSITGYYVGRKQPGSKKVIHEVVQSAFKCIDQRFPSGPFGIEDLLTLAMIESNFSQFAIGPHGEKGIFQILDSRTELGELFKSNANIFDPAVNTEVACFILSKKFSRYRDFYSSIIAYNGIIKKKDGKLHDAYWKRFVEARSVVQSLCFDL